MNSFDDRYRLLKCVALGGGIRTHNAQESSTGRPVMVHILDGAEPDTVERLRAQVEQLPVPDRSKIIELTATAGGFAIVSEFLAGLTTFPEWLGARAPDPAAALPPPPAPPRKVGTTESFMVGRVESSRPVTPPPAPPPGEFTRLFQGAGAAPAEAASASQPVLPAAPIAPAPAPPAPAPATPPRVPNVAPPAPRMDAAPSIKPGEFTALFRPPAAPSPSDIASSPLVPPTSAPAPSFGPSLGA